MDEEVIKQQGILAKTLEIAIARLEAASKFYGEKAAELSRTTDEVIVLVEALKKSLSESDQAIDDLAAITKLQRAMYQAQQDETGA